MSNRLAQQARKGVAFAILAAGVSLGGGVDATGISIAKGITGNAKEGFKTTVAPWKKETGSKTVLVPMPLSTTDQFGQYRLRLAAENSSFDLYTTDVIWALQLADQFIDPKEAADDLVDSHFPPIIQFQTIEDKLVMLPIYSDAPALNYRKDLLEKHGASVPKTWENSAQTAQIMHDTERDMWGFVRQGNAYVDLTWKALEWVKSFGGGQIVEPDGTISMNNEKVPLGTQEGLSPRQGCAHHSDENGQAIFNYLSENHICN